MIGIELGRRYERLLYFSLPLTIACLFILFLVIASTSQKDKVEAKCLQQGAQLIEADSAKLSSLWKVIEKDKYETRLAYNKKIIEDYVTPNEIGCFDILGKAISADKSPYDNIANLNSSASVLSDNPINYFGIQIPETASIALSGTNIKVALSTITLAIQWALGPIIILWLAGLYNTRFREVLFISKADSIYEIFPHATNLYVMGYWDSLRKKSRFRPHLPLVLGLIYAFTRVMLLLIFILPPVVAYTYALNLALSELSSDWWYLLLLPVVVFLFPNIMLEFFPWHFWKRFDGPLKI